MMHATPYNEVNELLQTLMLNLQTVLNNNLIGVYLYGSLTWGDFSEQVSDIDLLVVTEKFINKDEFIALNTVHENLVKNYNAWHDRIEIAYVSKETLKTFKVSKSPIAVISPGEAFNIKESGKDWLINYYLIQENSVTLFGPKPNSIIEPISKTEFISGVKDQAFEWRQWIEHTKGSTGYQLYAVLTICRALYAIHNGEQGSKNVAAKWMRNRFPKWAHLIDQSLSWRSQSNQMENNNSFYPEVEKFVFEMLDLLK